jgi:hypothetical protein
MPRLDKKHTIGILFERALSCVKICVNPFLYKRNGEGNVGEG